MRAMARTASSPVSATDPRLWRSESGRARADLVALEADGWRQVCRGGPPVGSGCARRQRLLRLASGASTRGGVVGLRGEGWDAGCRLMVEVTLVGGEGLACNSYDLHGGGLLVAWQRRRLPCRGAVLHWMMMGVCGRWWSSAGGACRGRTVQQCGCGGVIPRGFLAGAVKLGVLSFRRKPCLALCRCRQRRHS